MKTTSKMEWHPLAYVTEPQGQYVQVLRDYWWVLNMEGEVAIYDGRAPQANLSKTIAQGIAQEWDGGVIAVQIPLAFVTVDPRDWA